MSYKPWKPLLLTALAVGAGATAATAQNIATAQKAIELGRYNEARAALRGSNSPEANFELGRLYQMRDLPDSASYYFNRAAGPTPFGQVAEGRALLAKGKASEADAKFSAAASATKNKDPKVLTMIAQAYGEYDGKNMDITKPLTYVKTAEALSKGKDNPALMVARGDIYLHSDAGGGEAMSSYDRAVAADPNYTEAYYKRGVLNVRSKNGAGAQENFNKAIALNSAYAPAYLDMASMYASASQYDKALAAFQQYTNVAEKSPSTTEKYAAFLYLSKKYAEALAQANEALAKEPNNLTMNRIKATSLYETGDYAGAAAAMDQFMKVAPADKILPEDYSYQSKILLKTGRNDEAINVLQKAIAATTDPEKKSDLQNDLATAYMAKKDYPAAIRIYKTKANPDLADQFRLGSAFNGSKQYAQADSVYNIIITAKPTYVPAYQARAQANFHLDPDSKKGLAKPYYEKYIELANADPTKYKSGLVEANNYLGYYNLQAGNKAAATPYYQKVLELDPSNADATNAMKIIKGVPARTTTTAKKTTTTVKKK
ncbi:tetratricopeptide repeat protein [Hymenobacter ginsengisoli]|uniref:Tetratricopeptide repeat protein n=1 Tax=Hymenobacter ginsengisoli TaxID=1051626 RepID=A0ABP8QC87_9BACT|nr:MULTISPECIES: tetratricopeptide repeat protein [unclassified Hymenobacter]MBO2032066.1 tetratricopeptide repeat protein [Hymenobacter sp. BT559]